MKNLKHIKLFEQFVNESFSGEDYNKFEELVKSNIEFSIKFKSEQITINQKSESDKDKDKEVTAKIKDVKRIDKLKYSATLIDTTSQSLVQLKGKTIKLINFPQTSENLFIQNEDGTISILCSFIGFIF